MKNWMKIGIAGVALAGTMQTIAQEVPPEEIPNRSVINEDGGFSIEAGDLVAKKLRDHYKDTKEIEIA